MKKTQNHTTVCFTFTIVLDKKMKLVCVVSFVTILFEPARNKIIFIPPTIVIILHQSSNFKNSSIFIVNFWYIKNIKILGKRVNAYIYDVKHLNFNVFFNLKFTLVSYPSSIHV